jgi:hypothetical protein
MDPEDKCLLCPVGYIQTKILGKDHLHDHCDGCSYRLCMATVPCGWRS